MSVYKYFTKDTLIEAARAGNERGYNRQLDADAVQDLKYDKFLPVVFSMVHEHIRGQQVEPHIRAMVMIGPDGEMVAVDMSMDRFHELPELVTP